MPVEAFQMLFAVIMLFGIYRAAHMAYKRRFEITTLWGFVVLQVFLNFPQWEATLVQRFGA